MLSEKYRVTTLSVLVILAFSTFLPALVYAAPLANNDKDWQYMNGNSWAWNYSPQTQINKNNVDQLEVKWMYPIGSKALSPAAIQALNPAEGASTPPLVVNGKVLIATNALKIIAIDGKTGRELWTYDYNINVTQIKERIPAVPSIGHMHGINYWEAGNAIVKSGIACDFFGVNLSTGKESFWIKDLCANIPGTIYEYRTGPNQLSNVGIYDKGKQFVYYLSHPDGAGWPKSGRSVLLGVSMDTQKVLWRVFNQPPQDVPTKDWALQECDIGYFLTTPCKEVAAKNQAGLEWDWQLVPGQPPHWSAGVSGVWGQTSVDEETGIAYLSTGNQVPWNNQTMTPGPRLYGSTIMAIDLDKGSRKWWLQPFPHDPYDYDCNWNGILADVPGLGKVYVKGCKEGRLYWMDAATGKPKQVVDVMDDIYPGKKHYHLTDPLSYYDLREWAFPDNGKYDGPNTVFIPSWHNGAFGTDITYDPTTSTLYHYVGMLPRLLVRSLPMTEGGGGGRSIDIQPTNTTIVARDLVTGQTKWKWFYAFSAQRSHLVATSDILYTGFTDGSFKFFDKETGQILRELNAGAPLVIGPTIGKDSDGNSKIFAIVGVTGAVIGAPRGIFGPARQPIPGTLVAIGLSERSSAAKTTTVTTTQSTTVTTSIVQTQTTGLPSEVTYAAIGIAVIAIAAAAVLVMRKKQ